MVAADSGIEVRAPVDGRSAEVLTPEALSFVASLQREFGAPSPRAARARGSERQARIEAGELPDFLAETATVRRGRLARGSGAGRLRDRRCEITGPVERKMMINALNSGARVFMADFEDANSPTWHERGRGPGELLRRGPPHDRARHAREEPTG